MYFVFHFLKYLCNVNSRRRLVWLQCTFSHSVSLDSDFDCVHLTIQGILSLVWSPGKTILIHGFTGNKFYHYTMLKCMGYLYLHKQQTQKMIMYRLRKIFKIGHQADKF